MSISAQWTSKPVVVPSLHDVHSTWLTYELFYGLREKPFSLSSDPAFFYGSRSHAKAFEDLQSGIRRRESLSVLSGDIGTGKTTLCRAVLQKLDLTTFSAFVPDPFASREDLLKVVLIDFGVVSADDFTSGRLKGASRTELSYLLYEFLATLTPLEAFAVVFIDEAQNLSPSLLEEIRILSDSDGRQRQLQVVLVGQIELRDKLRLPELRQVDQRVSVRCDLGPLDQAGVAGYIAHRLSVAGGSPDRVSFSGDGIAAVYQASGGVPRLINRVCDRALHQGHLRQVAIIDREIVEATLPGMELASRSREIPASPATPPASDPIDQWYAEVDRGVTIACESEVIAEQEVAEYTVTPAMASPGRRQRVRTVPLTRIEALTRKWVRRAQVAALVIVVLGGAGLGLMVTWTIVSDSASPVTLPALPGAPRRAAAVKANVLSADAFASGVVTYSIQLPALDKPEGASRLVIASYATRAEAESELTRLHELPGYEAAIAVETSDAQRSR
jgi:type II secretory pathway predicted ATPase ExeA